MQAGQKKVMASRSARSPKARTAASGYDDEGGLGAFLARHRLVVGGVTAFAVTFAYVSANAVWYQPHAHDGVFFATRPPVSQPQEQQSADAETVIRIERETAEDREPPVQPLPLPLPARAPEIETVGTVPVPSIGQDAALAPDVAQGDPTVREVQRILTELDLYSGKVDGLTGPQTDEAILAYRKMVGLGATSQIDDQLLNQLGAARRATAIAAAPPVPQTSPGTDMIETSSAAPRKDAMVMRIQAGLRAFGNDGVEIDGVVGLKTSAAIREFQSLFGLPVTGQPDPALYAKMREIGLTE